jgi:ABC-type transport system substrate-binding protein
MELFDPDQECVTVGTFSATHSECGTNWSYWGTEVSLNRDDAAVAEYRDLLAQARATIDNDELARLAIRAEQLLADEAVILPISHRPMVTGHSRRLVGVTEHRQGRVTWNAAEWYVTDR